GQRPEALNQFQVASSKLSSGSPLELATWNLELVKAGHMGRGLLEGRVALITGAGQGLGRAIAREYADEGAAVALVERNPETLEAARAELEARGRAVLAYRLDLTDHAAYRAAVADVLAKQGKLDVLVNNAAVAY